MKKIIYFLSSLLFACLLSTFAMFAFAEDTYTMDTNGEYKKYTIYTSGYYKYILLEDDTAMIVGNYGADETLKIPSMLDDHTITAIGSYAFENLDNITSIDIPNSIVSIGKRAFDNCDNLASVSIPSSVIYIEENPFTHCDNLTTINVSLDHPALEVIDGVLFDKNEKKLICYPGGFNDLLYHVPQDVLVIGDYAFNTDNSLVSINLGDKMTSIGDYAFCACKFLTSINLGDKITSIGDYAFYLCENLLSINIPNSVNHIGEYAFCSCALLQDIIIPEGITSISKYMFCNCKSLNSIIIPKGVTTIGEGAFSNCFSLDNVIIPEGVTTIEESAFSTCWYLRNIYIPDSVTSIGNSAFRTCDSLTSLIIPDGVEFIGEDAFTNSFSLILSVGKETYAAEYAQSNNISYTYKEFQAIIQAVFEQEIEAALLYGNSERKIDFEYIGESDKDASYLLKIAEGSNINEFGILFQKSNNELMINRYSIMSFDESWFKEDCIYQLIDIMYYQILLLGFEGDVAYDYLKEFYDCLCEYPNNNEYTTHSVANEHGYAMTMSYKADQKMLMLSISL